MSKTLEGMARAVWEDESDTWDYDNLHPETKAQVMSDQKRALLWLADNVSDEMADAYITELNIDDVRATYKSAIAAALRAAAEGK